MSTLPLPPVEEDTSICSHLANLIQRRRGASALKTEDTRSADDIERRFVDVVRWGALDQGIKRRKLELCGEWHRTDFSTFRHLLSEHGLHQTAPPECHSCNSPLSQPWACLTCEFVGCAPLHASTSRASRDCLPSHFANSTRCEIAVEPTTGAIFCSECDDCVYPDSFEALFRATRIAVEEEHDRSREGSLLGSGRGRGRGHWKAWEGPSATANGDLVKANCRGLRPLLNLSQTCFLSAILQALIHNPLLKAYFLSDKHNRHVCPNGGPRGLALGRPAMGTDSGHGTPADREKGCMCCEMDRAFEEFYQDDSSPYGPVTMLYAMWHASTELEGYGQQDAHSFFLAALDQIHAHAKGQLSSCNCIAHQTFAGSLVSAVTCSSCSATNTTVDPILDIQLDFPFAPLASTETLTLGTLLRRYCAEEKIGDHGRGYDCGSCGGGKGVTASKKLSIKKLPPVLSFQLKRFAHNSTSSKVETAVRFPSHLDMRPYVETSAGPSSKAPSVADGVSGPGGAASVQAKELEEELPSSLYSYDLFAVVTHEGKLDNGHYWADVRSGDEWWHCDDDKVTPTTLGAVLRQNAYMLFYVRRSLAYGQPMSRLLANGSNAGKTVNGKTANGTANGTVQGA